MAVPLLVVCSSYSYSDETVYGSTQNAADFGLNWVMTNILPQQAGLTVNGVLYQYTTVKEDEWDMLVHVQNEDAQGTGYIFRDTEDWSGVPSNTIRKFVPVNDILIDRWGDGSIEVEGQGSVEDAFVSYNYKYDPCFDPQTDPSCPDYVDPNPPEVPVIEVIDPLDDIYIQDQIERQAQIEDEEQEERDRRRASEDDLDEDERLEAILGIVEMSLLAEASAQIHADFIAMNYLPASYSYVPYKTVEYKDVPMLVDKKLPENKKARRLGLAQELQHQRMIDLQYDNE